MGLIKKFLSKLKLIRVEKIIHCWQFPAKGCLVKLDDKVLKKILKMAIQALPHETGGTLIGRYDDVNKTADIQFAIGVKKGGSRGFNFFYRPSDRVDKQLSKIYKKSKGKRYYLGEWHTHPYSSPIPSPIDQTTLFNIASSASVAIDNPILLIIANNITMKTVPSCYVFNRHSSYYCGDYIQKSV